MDWITAIKEIQKAQEDDRLVVFVGAGVSKKLRCTCMVGFNKKVCR